jgi:hypothetical protein
LDVLIDWPGGDWQATAQLAAILVGGYLFILWTTSVLWVYRDIRQRTRDPVSQLTAVAISIVFPLVSLPVYAALRPSETLQDSYLQLLEREVLLSELGTMQSGGDPRRISSRANSTDPVAKKPPLARSTPVVSEPPARSRGSAVEAGRVPVDTELKTAVSSKTATDEPDADPDADEARGRRI